MPLQEVAEWETTETGNAGDADGFPDGFFVGDTPQRLREMQAALAKYFLDAIAGTKLTTGTSSVYALAPNASDTDFSSGSPPDGAIYSFKPHVLCAAGAQLSVAGSTARAIKWIDDTILTADQIGPAFIVVVRFSSSGSCFFILSPTKAQSTTINATTVQNLIDASVQGGTGTFTKAYEWTSRVAWALLSSDYSSLNSAIKWSQSTADPTRVYVVASSALQNLAVNLSTGDKVKLNATEFALAAAPSVVDEENNVLELRITALTNLAASVGTLKLRFATQTITAADAGDGVPNVAAVEAELEALHGDDRAALGDASDSLKTKWASLTRLLGWLQDNLAFPAATASLAWSAITGKPARFPSTWGTVSGKPATFPSTWGTVSGKPTTFSPNVAAVGTQLTSLNGSDRLASGDASDSLKTKWFSLTRLRDWLQDNLTFPAATASLAWSAITGKPATFPSTWATVSGKPSFGTASTKNTGTTSGTVPLLNSEGRLNVGLIGQKLTQAEFDALTPDENTAYFIIS